MVILSVKSVSQEIAVTTFLTLPVTAPSSCGLTRKQAATECTMMAWLATGANKYEDFLD